MSKRIYAAVIFGSTILAPATRDPISAERDSAALVFGISTAISGDQVLIAETETAAARDAQFRQGKIGIYRQRTPGAWRLVDSIMAPAGRSGLAFGFSLAADARTMMIGVRGELNNRVLVYDKLPDGKWIPAGTLFSDNGGTGSIGQSVVLHGEDAFIAAPSDSVAKVYHFHRDSTGVWRRTGLLMPANEVPIRGDQYGWVLAATDGWVAVASLHRLGQGGVFLFRRNSDGSWMQAGDVIPTPADVAVDNIRINFALQFIDNSLFIGVTGGSSGQVVQYEIGGTSGWTRKAPLKAPSNSLTGFGASLARVDGELWIGSTADSNDNGAIYRLKKTDAGGGAMKRLTVDSLGASSAFGGNIVSNAGIAVVTARRDGMPPAKGIGAVALPGLDESPGTVIILSKSTTGEWLTQHRAFIPPAVSYSSVTGKEVPCGADGKAAVFECGNTTLLSYLPVSALGGYRGTHLSGMWGWTDPQSGKDYALIGRTDGTAFVDVSDPVNPKYLGELPRTAGATTSNWREIKTYRNYMLVISDGSGDHHGVQIFDLTHLRGLSAPKRFSEDDHYALGAIHDIAVNEASGFAYVLGANRSGETCSGGLHMIDLHDPLHPKFVGCFADAGTGRAGAGYTHDAQCVMYHGPDTRYTGHEVCVAANETHISIQDVSDKKNVKVISHASYPSMAYAHQGWFSEDQRYWFFGDELDEEGKLGKSAEGTRTLVWDLSKLDDPIMAKEYIGPTRAIDHNQFVKGNRLYQSNYTAGLRILDISNPLDPKEVGYFDTHPQNNNTEFSGSWSNYPWFRNGAIGVVSMAEGFFLVRDRTGGKP